MAVIIIVAAVGVGAFYLTKDKNNEINLIAAVNTNGSGLYIDKSIDTSHMLKYDATDQEYYVDESCAPYWSGLVFGTPGISTIQHVQLLQLATDMGMNFALYQANSSNDAPNTLYYDPQVPNADTALSQTRSYLDGGTLWQPQFQKIITDSRFVELVLTGEVWPGHACCCIAGSNSYLTSNSDQVVSFLAAYVQAVNWVNDAINYGDPTSANYNSAYDANYAWLVEEGQKLAGNAFTQDVIEESLRTVTYTYGDSSNPTAPLSTLSTQVGTLADQLEALGNVAVKKTLSDLGFNNSTEFANKFVVGDYLAQALQLVEDGTPTSSGSMKTLTVAVIAGDIHQIAVHVAQDLPKEFTGGTSDGFFAEYGLNVNFSSQTNGIGVATAVQNGNSVLGVMGAPPITITVINGELVKA
ncbi:MAG: hypothetical protein FWF07_01465 [Methanomassiliicoccaceae archaeon]|nr:hypothetical protein [Methanomassiliicoccaceae archaeon]